MVGVSSQDLHPTAGARFVFERKGEEPVYALAVYLPAGLLLEGSLVWDEEGKAQIALSPEPSGDASWVVDGAAKLARVLKREPKTRLSRWRDR